MTSTDLSDFRRRSYSWWENKRGAFSPFLNFKCLVCRNLVRLSDLEALAESGKTEKLRTIFLWIIQRFISFNMALLYVAWLACLPQLYRSCLQIISCLYSTIYKIQASEREKKQETSQKWDWLWKVKDALAVRFKFKISMKCGVILVWSHPSQ